MASASVTSSAGAAVAGAHPRCSWCCGEDEDHVLPEAAICASTCARAHCRADHGDDRADAMMMPAWSAGWRIFIGRKARAARRNVGPIS